MLLNTPQQISGEFGTAGQRKGEYNFTRFALLAILGGAFIAFGGLLTVMVAGGMPEISAANPGWVRFISGALFPIGLVMVTLAGADLFTSDCAMMPMAVMQRKSTLWVLLRVWLWSYLFNFLGAQLVAWFLSSDVGLFSADPWRSYLHHVAKAKVSMSFYTVFMKGIGANWLVCLGAWMAVAAKDVMGKVIGIWIPVMLFVTLGYEHSIANMFFVPAAIYSGSEVLWSEFIVRNLIPATLGNIVGGAVFVGLIYGYIYTQKQN